MRFKNTKDTYGLVAKVFHWFMVFLILGLILVGLYMEALPYSPDKIEIYLLHKSFGLIILWLVGLRILWKLFTVSPEPQKTHQKGERILAKIAHLFLYVSMIGMPLSGWLMSSAAEYPVPFFGILMPDLVGKNPDLAKIMGSTHELLAYALIVMVGLHALGALKHHFIDGDKTLVRMMANPMRKVGLYFLMIILGLFALGVVKLGLIDGQKAHDNHEHAPVVETSSLETDINQALGSNEWVILQNQSAVSFKSSIYGKEFIGTFGDFYGHIIFDPDNLDASTVDITIKTSNINSGDSERDAQMMSEEWFHITDYPTARFKSLSFEEAAEGSYVAVGELTIKNRAMPVSLPFTLDIVETDEKTQQAFMKGQIFLNRLDFGLGEGRWEAADSIGLDVLVEVRLVAVLKK